MAALRAKTGPLGPPQRAESCGELDWRQLREGGSGASDSSLVYWRWRRLLRQGAGPVTDRPNILWIVLDAARADHLDERGAGIMTGERVVLLGDW